MDHRSALTLPLWPGAGSLFCWLLFVVAALVLAAPPQAAAAEAPAGRAILAVGGAQATGPDGTVRTLRRREPVYPGDVLRTGDRGRLQIRFSDGALLALRPGTELDIAEYAYQQAGRTDTTRLSLRRGTIRTLTGQIARTDRNNYSLSTPLAVIDVRGTGIDAHHDVESVVGAFDGAIGASPVTGNGRSVGLGEGQPFNYARVDSLGQVELLLGVPDVFTASPSFARGGGGQDGDGAEGDGEDGDGSPMRGQQRAARVARAAVERGRGPEGVLRAVTNPENAGVLLRPGQNDPLARALRGDGNVADLLTPEEVEPTLAELLAEQLAAGSQRGLLIDSGLLTAGTRLGEPGKRVLGVVAVEDGDAFLFGVPSALGVPANLYSSSVDSLVSDLDAAVAAGGTVVADAETDVGGINGLQWGALRAGQNGGPEVVDFASNNALNSSRDLFWAVTNPLEVFSQDVQAVLESTDYLVEATSGSVVGLVSELFMNLSLGSGTIDTGQLHVEVLRPDGVTGQIWETSFSGAIANGTFSGAIDFGYVMEGPAALLFEDEGEDETIFLTEGHIGGLLVGEGGEGFLLGFNLAATRQLSDADGFELSTLTSPQSLYGYVLLQDTGAPAALDGFTLAEQLSAISGRYLITSTLIYLFGEGVVSELEVGLFQAPVYSLATLASSGANGRLLAAAADADDALPADPRFSLFPDGATIRGNATTAVSQVVDASFVPGASGVELALVNAGNFDRFGEGGGSLTVTDYENGTPQSFESFDAIAVATANPTDVANLSGNFTFSGVNDTGLPFPSGDDPTAAFTGLSSRYESPASDAGISASLQLDLSSGLIRNGQLFVVNDQESYGAEASYRYGGFDGEYHEGFQAFFEGILITRQGKAFTEIEITGGSNRIGSSVYGLSDSSEIAGTFVSDGSGAAFVGSYALEALNGSSGGFDRAIGTFVIGQAVENRLSAATAAGADQVGLMAWSSLDENGQVGPDSSYGNGLLAGRIDTLAADGGFFLQANDANLFDIDFFRTPADYVVALGAGAGSADAFMAGVDVPGAGSDASVLPLDSGQRLSWGAWGIARDATVADFFGVPSSAAATDSITGPVFFASGQPISAADLEFLRTEAGPNDFGGTGFDYLEFDAEFGLGNTGATALESMVFVGDIGGALAAAPGVSLDMQVDLYSGEVYGFVAVYLNSEMSQALEASFTGEMRGGILQTYLDYLDFYDETGGSPSSIGVTNPNDHSGIGGFVSGSQGQRAVISVNLNAPDQNKQAVGLLLAPGRPVNYGE